MLDEHRSILVAKNSMKVGRCDVALHFYENNIYVLGGMAFEKGTRKLQSLSTCEVYNIDDDMWSEMAPFQHPRQQHSVCHFNEQFMFIFGGKRISPNSEAVGSGAKTQFYEPFEFVQEVEVYEMAKKIWKTINYISEPARLAVISPGSMQIAGSQILIFGGLVPREEHSEDKTFDVSENGVELSMSTHSLILDVTVGSIKYGPELATPTYFISGGYQLPHENQIHALGMTLPTHQLGNAMGALSGEDEVQKKQFEMGAANHKKLIHCYNVAEQKWTETNESIFSSGATARRDSDVNDD